MIPTLSDLIAGHTSWLSSDAHKVADEQEADYHYRALTALWWADGEARWHAGTGTSDYAQALIEWEAWQAGR